MKAVNKPNAIQIRLNGQIQIRGKNPASKRKSGTQIKAEPGAMQKLAIMLSTQKAHAEMPQIFFKVNLPAGFSVLEFAVSLSRVHFLDCIHQLSSLFRNILHMFQP